MAYFKPRFYRWGGTSGVFEDRIIANSAVVTTGGLVKILAGFVAPATAQARIWGLCVGIVGSLSLTKGIPLDKTNSGSDYHGTYVSGQLGTQKYTAASDNQTVDQICARIDVSPDLVMSNTPNAAIGTTTGSNLAGYFTDLVSDTQIAENLATQTFGTVCLTILGVDPETSTNVLVIVNKRSEMGA